MPFLLDPSLTGLSDAERGSLFAENAAATPAQQAATYPQSVASGDPRVDGIVLWTRVDPAVQAAPSNDLVAWQIGTSATFAPGTVLVEGAAALAPARDNTVKLPVSNAALQPFTGYFYRFLCNGVPSRTGQFKTLPLATTSLAQLRLGYVVCQDYGNGLLQRARVPRAGAG